MKNEPKTPTKVQAKTALTLYEKVGLKESSALSSEQILTIMQKTPANHIYQRPGKGGGMWDYVTGTYVEKVLNYVFAWDWDFEIRSKEEKYGQVVVLGRLTVRTMNGKSIFKEQVGRAEIKYRKGTQTPLDYGNDEKAAITDSLKKCASKFGIASDIYGKNEFREIETEVVSNDLREYKAGLKEQAVVDGVETFPVGESTSKTGTPVNNPAGETKITEPKPAVPAQRVMIKQWIKTHKVDLTEEKVDKMTFDEARNFIANMQEPR